MGIVVGATSGKFVMVAAMLLFQARIDGDPVPVAIAPGNPVSSLSAGLKHQLSSHGGTSTRIKIGIRGDYFYAAVDRVEADPATRAGLVIGQDILAEHPIDIDFARHQLASMLPGEVRARERHDHAIALRPDGAGHWHVALYVPGGTTIDALLDLGSTESVVLGADAGPAAATPDAVVKLSGETFSGVRLWRGGKGPTIVGLGVFAHRRVIFDLAHDRIWVAD